MKEKIINTAIRVFNDYGLSAVPMKQIAEELGISPGNLSYHFKSKEILLHAIRDRIAQETKDFFLPNIYLTLHHLEVMVNKFHEHTLNYSFIFQDFAHICRYYPAVAIQHEEINLVRIQLGRKLIDYYIDSGRMHPERDGVNYDYLLHTVWMLITFWPVQELTLTSPEYALVKRDLISSMWNLFLPHLTKMGFEEYNQIKKYVHSDEEETDASDEAED